ncbi:MAG: M20/M25/M40 family metallo-hydrolase [Chloroflexi bacterium]|nr:MAG: M20/M25/M40 family metallo-hydrolase [Chloroflexota bacterium]
MDVLELCRDLLRIDTSNPGSDEAAAAEYVADRLRAAGIAYELLEPAPGRVNLVSVMPGREPALPRLALHGHLDVVPADPAGWSHPPFAGEIAEGMLYGRGAVDMKGFVAMMLGLQLELAEHGRPRRDLVFCYLADEETGSVLGARWLAEKRPELLSGVAEAIGEVGGFSVALPGGGRAYTIQTAERGSLWFSIRVPGVAGHAALSGTANPVRRLGPLIERINALRVEEEPPAAFRALCTEVARLTGGPEDDPEPLLAPLGVFGQAALRGRRTDFVPTQTLAGRAPNYNVIPEVAELGVDCRYLPGGRERARTALESVLEPDMTYEMPASTLEAEAPVVGPLLEAALAAIRGHDPECRGLLPYVMPAGTDAAALSTLGIHCYGFTPLPLPDGFDYPAMFHARDERVPVESLRGGMEILFRLATDY